MAGTKRFLPFLGFIYLYALAYLGAEAAPTSAASTTCSMAAAPSNLAAWQAFEQSYYYFELVNTKSFNDAGTITRAYIVP